MHKINLRTFDLNLLLVFDALMRERHMGRAAQGLFLTQPAVSHALARLRQHLDDPLFVKHAKGMRATPRAEALAEPVAAVLQTLRTALSGTARFDPSQVQRTIAIGATDYIGLTLMPPLLAALRRQAPGIDLRQLPISRDSVVQDMRRRQIDFAIGPLGAASPAMQVTPLFSERMVLVARQGHPALQARLTRNAFADLPQLLVAPQGEAFGKVDDALREAGLTRRLVLTVPHFLTAPFVVGQTDLVCVLAERVAQSLAAVAGIAVRPLPVALPSWGLGLGRLKVAPADPALDWMARLVTDVAGSLEKR